MTQQPEHVEDAWASDPASRSAARPAHGERFPAARSRQQGQSGHGGPGGHGHGERHDRSPDTHSPAPAAVSFERVPPQDLEAEQSVLGGMMLSKDAIADVVEVLKGQDFYRPAHETVYEAILDLYAKGEPADPITVTAELTRRGEISRVGGPGYVHSLVQTVPTAANAEYYAEIVHERAVLRRLVEAGTRITQMGYAADGDVDDIVNSAQAEIYSVTEQRTSEDYLPLGDIMEGALDEIEAIGSRSGQMTGVPTGFTDLDSLTNGLHPGQMIVIAARPAMGKALALDTPLPTPTGWTTMGEVEVGDRARRWDDANERCPRCQRQSPAEAGHFEIVEMRVRRRGARADVHVEVVVLDVHARFEAARLERGEDVTGSVGVEVMPISEYACGRHPVANALMIGFAAVREDAMDKGMELLAAAIEAAPSRAGEAQRSRISAGAS